MKRTANVTTFFALLALCIAGCSTLGVPAADTFGKRIIVANGLVEQASATVETLFTAGKLSQPDATAYNQRTAEAGRAIDITQKVHVTDPTAADDRLAAIIAGLTALQTELQHRQGDRP